MEEDENPKVTHKEQGMDAEGMKIMVPDMAVRMTRRPRFS